MISLQKLDIKSYMLFLEMWSSMKIIFLQEDDFNESKKRFESFLVSRPLSVVIPCARRQCHVYTTQEKSTGRKEDSVTLIK